MTLEQLTSIAAALGSTLDAIVDSRGADDVVIRPQHHPGGGPTIWRLDGQENRPATIVAKIRLAEPAPVGDPDAVRVHPGDEWLMVISGSVQLLLDDRGHTVEKGDAASFSTMVPHAMGALDGPAVVLLVLDRDGGGVHQHL